MVTKPGFVKGGRSKKKKTTTGGGGNGGTPPKSTVGTGGLSTEEKLASLNPAVRREGQQELGEQTTSQQKKSVSKAKSIAKRFAGTTTAEQVEAETQQAKAQSRREAEQRTMAEPISTRTSGRLVGVSPEGFEIRRAETTVGEFIAAPRSERFAPERTATRERMEELPPEEQTRGGIFQRATLQPAGQPVPLGRRIAGRITQVITRGRLTLPEELKIQTGSVLPITGVRAARPGESPEQKSERVSRNIQLATETQRRFGEVIVGGGKTVRAIARIETRQRQETLASATAVIQKPTGRRVGRLVSETTQLLGVQAAKQFSVAPITTTATFVGVGKVLGKFPKLATVGVAALTAREAIRAPSPEARLVSITTGALVVGGIGATRVARAVTQRVGRVARERFAFAEIEGATTQRGTIRTVAGKEQLDITGRFIGKGRAGFEVKILGKPRRFRVKEFQEVAARTKFKGTRQEADLKIEAFLRSPKGVFSFKGVGVERFEGSRGAGVFELVGRQTGRQQRILTSGIRGFETALKKGTSLKIERPGQLITTRQTPFGIESILKIKPTTTIKTPSRFRLPTRATKVIGGPLSQRRLTRTGFRREAFVGEFPERFQFELGRRGRIFGSSEFGVTRVGRAEPTFRSEVLGTVAGPITVTRPIPRTAIETFRTVGSAVTEATTRSDRVRALQLEKQLKSFGQRRVRLPSGQLLGVGITTPAVTIRVPKPRPIRGVVATGSRIAPRQFALVATRATRLTRRPRRIGTILPSLAITPIIDSALKPETRPALKPAVRPALRPALEPALKPALSSAVKPTLRPALRPTVRPALLATVIGPSVVPTFTPLRPGLPLTIQPPIRLRNILGRGRRVTRRTKRQASLVAVELGLTTTRRKAQEEIFTGFGIRRVLR